MKDDDTKVEGELKVGATAKVTYRSEGNRKIANHVKVMPQESY